MNLSLYRWTKRLFRNDKHVKDLAFFRDVSIFHGLSVRQLGRLMQAMQKRPYYAGENLFKEGQIGKAVFIIRSGKVELLRQTPSGRTRSPGIVTPYKPGAAGDPPPGEDARTLVGGDARKARI